MVDPNRKRKEEERIEGNPKGYRVLTLGPCKRVNE